MTLRTSVFMPPGAEGSKRDLYTSTTKKTQIITISLGKFPRRQGPARRFGRRNSTAFMSALHQMGMKTQQFWFSNRSREEHFKEISREGSMKTVRATVSLIGFVAIALSAGCRNAPAADTTSATQHELCRSQDCGRKRSESPGAGHARDHPAKGSRPLREAGNATDRVRRADGVLLTRAGQALRCHAATAGRSGRRDSRL